MSSTNKTSNYELSQFLGTDKPAWLADYNSDMSKIDAQMKLNADGVTTANGTATTASNNIGTMPNLNTTDKSSLVNAINEVKTDTGTAQSTATGAAGTASSAKTEADALKSYLSITNTGKSTTTLTGGTQVDYNDVYYALNSSGTLGKIYGKYRFRVTTTGTVTLTIAVPGLQVNDSFTISSGFYYNCVSDGAFSVINARDITVNTNGTITLTWSNFQINELITVWLPPCLYFFTDFGDVYNPE